MKMAHIPAIVHPHLDAIQHEAGGGVLLAASSLTGRYWTGSLWYYDNVELAPDVERCSAGVELESGCNDFVLFNDNNIFLGTDSGTVQLWSLNKEEHSFTLHARPQGHDNVVNSVSVDSNKSRGVAGSHDKVMKVYDLEECMPISGFRGHSDIVHCVACHPQEPDLVLSCSQDGRTLLWDLRKPKPANILDISSLDGLPTTVAWRPGHSQSFAVGSETGSICLQDCRTTEATPISLSPHTRSVHRLAFHPSRSDWVASVSDDCTVAVTEFTNSTPKLIYQDKRHRDFTRGISWNLESKRLVTTGWDLKVLSHVVNGDVVMDTGDPTSPEANMETETVNGKS